MKNVVVDFRISKKSENTLTAMGYNIIKTVKEPDVVDAICGHPDIMLCKLKNNDVAANTTFRGILSKNEHRCNIIEGKSVLRKEYPNDIAYNSALVGNNLFCNEKYTDSAILDYCRINEIKILNIKQGYAKCSICIVSDNAIITSDKNISDTAIKNNIDVLLIENKGIILKGYSEGFIGGATGLIENNLLAVNGNIKLHKDYIRIKQFCREYGVDIVSLSDEPICDIGSIIRLENSV